MLSSAKFCLILQVVLKDPLGLQTLEFTEASLREDHTLQREEVCLGEGYCNADNGPSSMSSWVFQTLI